MTIEEAKEFLYTYTSPTSGIPSPSMTNIQWQHKFEIMKLRTVPAKEKLFSTKLQQEWISIDEFENIKYDGQNKWQLYCTYINNVLQNIRHGEIDYCYYTYQIQDLIRFEHTRLKTKYYPNDQYWIVWLE